MDHDTRATEKELRKYADIWGQGIWRCNGLPVGNGPVLIGFGTKEFTHEALEALDRRLTGRTDAGK